MIWYIGDMREGSRLLLSAAGTSAGAGEAEAEAVGEAEAGAEAAGVSVGWSERDNRMPE